MSNSIPAVDHFIGGGGLGDAHPQAPAERAQFGRLVGIWDAKVEMRPQSGAWVESAPAVWVFKYALGGFAIQDLWIHTEDNLPSYLGALGRPYQLTSLRIYEVRSNQWRSAWAANGAGKTPGFESSDHLPGLGAVWIDLGCPIDQDRQKLRRLRREVDGRSIAPQLSALEVELEAVEAHAPRRRSRGHR